ncbi:MAG: thymidine phosphorylase [Candidatus Melainabacteria bacterium]|nr:thymidine phosphorylase [Candidatus Melainabacteria bacterium]
MSEAQPDTMNIVDIIDAKRRGQTHSQEEIAFLVHGMQQGTVRDYQVAAWLMAVCLQGLNLDETTWLTEAFVRSGDQLDLSGVGGVTVDKHSTGGVGDKTTLVLAPLLAAAGVKVAKLSGRGLGFTGGTIDKLEAITGFETALPKAQFLKQVQEIGVAIGRQTGNLAPADGTMYALRDVTATVDSIPLIAASVVSKKIAAGASVIVLDIKCGRGAFMKDLTQARQLAETCQAVGQRLGKRLVTVISSMEQPLGYAVGHSVELMEVIRTLRGEGPADLTELCQALGSIALLEAGLAKTPQDAVQQLTACVESGRALATFKAMVVAQGGDPECLEDFSLLPQPARISMIPSPVTGTVQSIDALMIARAAQAVGAGRRTKEDPIDLGVGVVLHKKVGDTVQQGETLVELYSDAAHATEAMDLLRDAFCFTEGPVTPPPLILLEPTHAAP